MYSSFGLPELVTDVTCQHYQNTCLTMGVRLRKFVGARTSLEKPASKKMPAWQHIKDCAKELVAGYVACIRLYLNQPAPEDACLVFRLDHCALDCFAYLRFRPAFTAMRIGASDDCVSHPDRLRAPKDG